MIDMLHKLALTSLLAFVPSANQLIAGLAITVAYLCVLLVRKPYRRKGDDRLHLLVQVCRVARDADSHGYPQNSGRKICFYDQPYFHMLCLTKHANSVAHPLVVVCMPFSLSLVLMCNRPSPRPCSQTELILIIYCGYAFQSPKVQTELSQQALYDYMMSFVLILIMFGLAALFVGQGVKFVIKWYRQWWAKRNPVEAKARAARANLREPVYCGQRETQVRFIFEMESDNNKERAALFLIVV